MGDVFVEQLRACACTECSCLACVLKVRVARGGLAGAAQQLADELGGGGASTPLMERLNGRGTFSGSAGRDSTALPSRLRQPEHL
eukprot:585026-Pleurochrysis_carterae.AAC.1